MDELEVFRQGYEAGQLVAFTLALNECGDDDSALYERILRLRDERVTP